MEQTTKLISSRVLSSALSHQATRALSTAVSTSASEITVRFRPDAEATALVQQVFTNGEDSPTCAVFSGVDRGCGCSRIAASTAAILANQGILVCLVEANFRSPSLASLFGMPRHFGVAEALAQESSILHNARPVGNNELLWLVPAGEVNDKSIDLLTSPRFAACLEQLRREFSVVIIDAPPVSNAETTVLARQTDGVILVLEGNRTRRDSAQETARQLRLSKVPLLAAVLNRRTNPIPDKFDARF